MSDDPVVYRRPRRRSYIAAALNAESVFPRTREDAPASPSPEPGAPRCVRCERAIRKDRGGWWLVVGADNGCVHAPIPCVVVDCLAPGIWWGSVGYCCSEHAGRKS